MATVRPARLEDAAALAGVHVRSWQAAYRGVLTDDFLDGLSVPDRAEWWTGRLARVPPRWAVLVVERDGEPVGFVTTGTTDDRIEPSWGELYALYVEPAYWRRGFGAMLLAAAEQTLRANAFVDALLWVLNDNIGAKRFYEKSGWRHDGAAKRMIIGPSGVAAVRYTKGLAQPNGV